jgi:hypothetical protein
MSIVRFVGGVVIRINSWSNPLFLFLPAVGELGREKIARLGGVSQARMEGQDKEMASYIGDLLEIAM